MLSLGVTVRPDPPHTHFLDQMMLAEENGFDYGWTFDSHIRSLMAAW
jgi:alkanesulfonate monooxygenase SsuD/methylene tetrahydromethanopterin reductase-like flavin-dependent oxidoreductase (luciferase family)